MFRASGTVWWDGFLKVSPIGALVVSPQRRRVNLDVALHPK